MLLFIIAASGICIIFALQNPNTMKRLFFCFFLFAMLVSAASAQRHQTVERYAAHERGIMHVSCVAGQTGRPVVVWFHSGGLTGGKAAVPDELKGTDYVVVAPAYRLLPSVPVDSCIDDAAAAVAWTFRNIDRFGGDPSRIIVSGHSAGGYLASMIGFDKSWLKNYGIDADSIAALVPFSGQAITHYAWRTMQGTPELQPTVDRYAPLYHVRPDAPPYVIVCGDRELELFGRYEENAYLYRMLLLTGHPDVSIYELDGYDHGAMASPAFHILKKTVARLWKD